MRHDAVGDIVTAEIYALVADERETAGRLSVDLIFAGVVRGVTKILVVSGELRYMDAQWQQRITHAERDGDKQLAPNAFLVLLHALATLSAATDYIVEVVPPRDDSPRAARTARIKPWLRPLPECILLSPGDRHRYGYPDHGGTHASPTPHARRGHWRTLRAERYGANRGKRVWAREAWIGDREWQHEGRTYRIIDTSPREETP
jgi:hypothetical protein